MRQNILFFSFYEIFETHFIQLREECMHEMDSSMPGAPTVMVVDAGDVFVGGRYHSLVPILRLVKGALSVTEI